MAGWLKTLFLRRDRQGERLTPRPSTPPPVPRAAASPPRRQEPFPMHKRTPGTIYRRDYLSPEQEAELFTLSDDGRPTGYLARKSDRLVIVPDSKPREMVNPKSTRLHRLGIFSFSVRGTSYYAGACKSADLRPGTPVRLVREPDNDYDENAIAIYSEKGSKKIGHVNKQNAKRMAKLIDSGEDFSAIATRGDRPGRDEITPMILAARSEVLAHLMRRL